MTRAKKSRILAGWMFLMGTTTIPVDAQESNLKADGNGNSDAVSESPEELANLVGELDEQRESEGDYRFNPLDSILEPWNEGWRWIDRELNLSVGFTHTTLYQAATKGSYTGPSSGGAGDLDIFGTWNLLNSGKESGIINGGKLGFSFEYRHTLDDSPPSALGKSIGSLWGTASGFDDQEFALIQWWWQQEFFDNSIWFRAGKIDLATIFDVYRFNSVNHYYVNAAFSDNPAIPFPENGWGIAGGWDVTEEWFLKYGFSDAEARKTETINTGNIDAWMTMATIGWNGDVADLGKGLYQVTGWHSDRRDEPMRPSATGFSVVAQQELGNGLVPFARYAWSEDAAVDVKSLITAGAVLEGIGQWENDRIGFAGAWGSPHDPAYRDQWSAEVFYRMELIPEFRLTPHAQIIVNPSRNRDDDVIAIFGVRGRLTF